MIIEAFIQNEKGSRQRFRYNEKTLAPAGVSELRAPATYQYGFIPDTLGEDGDCIDIWLISDTDFKIGSPVRCRILGMLEMHEEYRGEREEDFKIFCCPEHEGSSSIVTAIDEIKSYTLEIFKAYPEVSVSFGDFRPAADARRYIISRLPAGDNDKSTDI